MSEVSSVFLKWFWGGFFAWTQNKILLKGEQGCQNLPALEVNHTSGGAVEEKNTSYL